MGCTLQQILLTGRDVECYPIALQLRRMVRVHLKSHDVAQILIHPDARARWSQVVSGEEPDSDLHEHEPLEVFDGDVIFTLDHRSGMCFFHFPVLNLICTGRRFVEYDRKPRSGTDRHVARLEERLRTVPPHTLIIPSLGEMTTVRLQLQAMKNQKELQPKRDEDGDEDDEQMQVSQERQWPASTCE